MNPRVLAGYVISTGIWSTTWLAIKYALLGFAPLTGAGVRFIVAGVLLYAIAAFVRGPSTVLRHTVSLLSNKAAASVSDLGRV